MELRVAMDYSKQVFVAGHNGLVGGALCRHGPSRLPEPITRARRRWTSEFNGYDEFFAPAARGGLPAASRRHL
jgi:hypothetical protein